MKLKRAISFFLMLVLAVSLLSTVIFAAEEKVYTPIDSFQVSTDTEQVPYYMAVCQPTEEGKPYYFLKGGASTAPVGLYDKYSLPTTKSVYESTPVYIEQVANGYRMYYLKSGVRSYIAITGVGASNNQKDQTDAKNTFSWDEENKVFYQMDTVLGDAEPTKYILAITTEADGTNKDRITAQRWDDYVAAKEGAATIYPVRLYTPEGVGLRQSVEVDKSPVVVPKAGVPYFLAVNQKDVNTMYYWIGSVVDTTAALYLETNADNGKATIVFLEEYKKGYIITQMRDGKKQFLYIYRKGADMALGIVDDVIYASVFEWNEEYNTFVVDYLGTKYFMGVNTAMNDDGTVKTAYTKLKPIKTTSISKDHVFTSCLIALPESVEVEVPPAEPTVPVETESAEDQTGGHNNIPEPAAPKTSTTNMTGLLVAVVLLVAGVTLLIVDNKKVKKDPQ